MMSEGVYEIVGIKFVYERNYRELERLTVEGLIIQDIVLEVSIKIFYFIKDLIFFFSIYWIKFFFLVYIG